MHVEGGVRSFSCLFEHVGRYIEQVEFCLEAYKKYRVTFSDNYVQNNEKRGSGFHIRSVVEVIVQASILLYITNDVLILLAVPCCCFMTSCCNRCNPTQNSCKSSFILFIVMSLADM